MQNFGLQKARIMLECVIEINIFAVTLVKIAILGRVESPFWRPR